MTTELVELAADMRNFADVADHCDITHICNTTISLRAWADRLDELASRAGGLDHRDLLAKYVRYVGDVEGADFVSSGYRGYDGDQKFTPEEWAELTRISDEVNGPAAPEPLAVG